jgi:hypothetical protein
LRQEAEEKKKREEEERRRIEEQRRIQEEVAHSFLFNFRQTYSIMFCEMHITNHFKFV